MGDRKVQQVMLHQHVTHDKDNTTFPCLDEIAVLPQYVWLLTECFHPPTSWPSGSFKVGVAVQQLRNATAYTLGKMTPIPAHAMHM